MVLDLRHSKISRTLEGFCGATGDQTLEFPSGGCGELETAAASPVPDFIPAVALRIFPKATRCPWSGSSKNLVLILHSA
jgi:hypothetical protein